MIDPGTLIQDMTAAAEGLKRLEAEWGTSLTASQDLKELVQAFGLKVIPTDELPDGVEAFLTDQTEEGGTIALNTKGSPISQQYSLAHELGHHFLFHDHESDLSQVRQEQQANAFACFLMFRCVPGAEWEAFYKANPDLVEITAGMGMVGIGILFSRLPWLGIPLALVFGFWLHWRYAPAPNPAPVPAPSEEPHA